MATNNPSRVKIRVPKQELAEFCRRYNVQKLALFGSVERGNGFARLTERILDFGGRVRGRGVGQRTLSPRPNTAGQAQSRTGTDEWIDGAQRKAYFRLVYH